MTEQKYWKIIDEEFISYYGGNAYLISNGDCKFHIWERKEDAQKVCDLLNELTNKGLEYDSFRLKVALSIQHRINWLKKQIWDNTDRINELQSLKKELKLNGDVE